MGFALIFTMLGLAAMQFSGLQNESEEKSKFSAQAIWLADGNIDRARNNLASGAFLNESCPEVQSDNCLNKSTYVCTRNDFYTDQHGPHYYHNRWRVDSCSSMNGQNRG